MPFTIKIEPEWNIIKTIKKAIANDPIMLKQGRDFLEATTMTAIELVENALKYSDFEASRPVEFLFDANLGRCHISVINGCRKQESKDALLEILSEIKKGDPFTLYVARLQKLKDNPDGFSRMGLLRISYEAEFKLDAKIEDSMITISAERKLDVTE